MSVVLNTLGPSSVFKRKHNEISYHHVKEGNEKRIKKFSCIKSEEMSVIS
jgi:hypothetical protein